MSRSLVFLWNITFQFCYHCNVQRFRFSNIFFNVGILAAKSGSRAGEKKPLFVAIVRDLHQEQRLESRGPFHIGRAGRVTEGSCIFPQYSQHSGKSNHSQDFPILPMKCKSTCKTLQPIFTLLKKFTSSCHSAYHEHLA